MTDNQSFPAAHPVVGSAVAGAESSRETVAPAAPTVPSPEAYSRVGEFLQALGSERRVTNEEVRQHAIDCTHLLEVAMARFAAYHDPADREHAVLWREARDQALLLLRERGHTFVDLGR